MWVAESFFKPINGKDLEESGEEYLMDLPGRNLIMIHEKEFTRKMKFCNMHDLLRDLCIREARKEKFVYVANQHSEGLNTQRRIAIHQDASKKVCLDSIKDHSTTRSLVCYSGDVALPLAEVRLLRLLTRFDARNDRDIRKYRLEDFFRLVNLRYLSVDCQNHVFASSVFQLWNLQTLYVRGLHHVVAPPEIWNMSLIRHIQMNGLTLPDPPSSHTEQREDFVLHELHTLLGIYNLKLSEEVVKRIPNVKRLGLSFDRKPLCLNNLDRLYKLEDFSISFSIMFEQFHPPPNLTELLQNITFPHSLNQLALKHTKLHWEDISTKIGSLPCLQMLILDSDSFIGPEWKTVEGQFCSLKYLQIESCDGLKCWSTESTHFPCLECLHLIFLENLEEIPLCIGDIPTLKPIIVRFCTDSAVISAKRILDEQEELGNESLRVKIMLGTWNDESLERLATHNFQI